MRGKQRAEQDRSERFPAERGADEDAERKRQDEREQAEADRRTTVLAQQVEIDLDPSDEHQIEQAKLAEVGQRAVARADQREPVRADRIAADEQADDSGDARAAEQHRPDQQHSEDDEELPRRALRRRDLDQRSDHSSTLPFGVAISISATITCRPSAGRSLVDPQHRDVLDAAFFVVAVQPVMGEPVDLAFSREPANRGVDRFGVA